MSVQQVNLYQDELKTPKLNYSARVLIQLSLILVVVFSALAGFRYFQLQQHQLDLAEQQQRQKIVMTELQKIQNELSLRKKDVALVQRISNRTKELTNKQKVLGILNRDEFGNTGGFIEHISGLARQRIDGLWLTQIRIAEGGTDVSLQGLTFKSSLLPRYLQRLSAEKAFSGTEFESLVMARQEKKKQWLNFSLHNRKTGEVVQ
ncbi:MAG: PilN domain-containing protein [Gammaproteobacteria bacterium]|nr:PilN domain-containing protein [Gammaproteobacteria bacterium]